MSCLGHADRSLRRARADHEPATASASPACGSCAAPTAAPRRRSRRTSSSPPPAARRASPPGSRRWATRARAEERLDVDVTYASRRLSLPADALDGDKFVLIGARPGHPRTLFLFAQEDGRWILGLGGYGPAHRPPSDPEGFAAFAATVAPPDVLEAIEAAEPLDEIATHRFPASVRRRYDRLRSFPAGLLVVRRRDLLVQPHLRAGHDGGRGPGGRAARLPRARRARPRPPLLPRRRAPRSITPGSCRSAPTWRCPRSRGTRSARVRLVNAYLRRLRATAEHDPAVAGAFIAVIGMLERPPHVLRPAIAARVARGPRPRRLERARRRRAPARAARRRGTHAAARGRAGGRAPRPSSSCTATRARARTGSRCSPPPAAAGAPSRGTPPGSASAPRRSRFAQTVSAHARVRRPRARRARDRARPPRRTRLRRALGPGAGQPASPTGSPARSCSAPARCRAIAGTRSPGCGARRTPASCSWPRRPASAFASCCGAATRAGFRGRSSTACTTTSTARPAAPSSSSTAPSPTWRGDGERLAQALRPLDRPALVLWGRHDPYLPVANAERQRAAFPRAEIRVLERSGHWPFVDDPATVTAA